MSIITLTTDLGLKDFYVAAVKGRILSLCPTVTIVDISHQIPPFDILTAAFCLKNVYQEFPKGTIHVLGVDPAETESNKHIVILHKGQYFIGSDTGVFSLIFDETPEEVFLIKRSFFENSSTFPNKSVFSVAAAHLANGNPLNEMIEGKHLLQEKNSLAPVIENNSIRGTVIYIDSMGNVTTNVTKDLFKNVGLGRSFEISYRRLNYTIKQISNNYHEVPVGERLAIFNNSKFLEIAINKGNASKLLGIKAFDTVRVDFV